MNLITLIIIMLIATIAIPLLLMSLAKDNPYLGITTLFVFGTATMYLCVISISIEKGTCPYAPYETNIYETTGEYRVSAGRFSTNIGFKYIKDGEVTNGGDNVHEIFFTENGEPSYVVERKYNIWGIRDSATDLYISEDEYEQTMKEYAVGPDSH